VIWLIQDFNLLSVILRALALSLEALTVGGVIVLLFVAPASRGEPSARDAVRKFISRFAFILAVIQLLAAAESTVVLMAGVSNLAFRDVIDAAFFRADCLLAVAAVTLSFLARRGKDRPAAFAALSLSLLPPHSAMPHPAWMPGRCCYS
jgi:putative copper resistance protein D